MRRLFVLLALTILASLLLSTVSAQRIVPKQFVGVWRNADVFDGSDQHMVITPRGGVRYLDRGASACGVDGSGEPLWPGRGKGTVTVVYADDTGFDIDLYFRCLGRGELSSDFSNPIVISFTYDPASDTLTDHLGNVWY